MFKSNSKLNKSKTFFHDLINHTHGIQLYLEQKMLKGEDVRASELKILFTEIQLMQTLIQDFFKYEHKNISKNYDYVPFDFVMQVLNQMIKIYFDEHVTFRIELKGKIAYFENQEQRESSFVHFPSIYRILNNLIKNISEAKSKDVVAIFDYTNENLKIEIKNSIFDVKNKDEVVERITRDLKNRTDEPGVGLESINQICNEANGTFELEIKDNYWINRIVIPHHKETNLKVAA